MRASILMNGHEPVNLRLSGGGTVRMPGGGGNRADLKDSGYKRGLEQDVFRGSSGGENYNGQRV